MSEQKIMNRWWVVVGALLIQVSLGAVYIWSVFQSPLKEVFPTWTEPMVTLPSQIVLACFALAVIFGGRLQDKFGPRWVATAGGVVLGLGLVLAKFAGVAALAAKPGLALVWLVGTFSVLGGIGIGIAYVCPIATCVKWFPDKRGLITGLAVAGFGAGSFFFAPLATGLIKGAPYKLLGHAFFPLQSVGIFNTFMVLGIIFLVVVVIGAQFLRNPPAGYVPAGWTPPQTATGAAKKVDFAPVQMLSTPNFWILWLTYFAGCTAGLMVIMKASPIWQFFAGVGLTSIEKPAVDSIIDAATMGVGILAIFNAAGRILWGKVSDNVGRRATLVIMFLLCGITMLVLNSMRSYGLYLTGVSLIGLCFGGFLALYPAVTADFFGTKHIGVNYGCMFSAYGAGGILGPMLAGLLMKPAPELKYQVADNAGQMVDKVFKMGDYRLAFIVAGIACLVAGALVAAAMKPPKAPEPAQG
jgi:OFA family oxalate/formate antiporter-like MFS transporter